MRRGLAIGWLTLLVVAGCGNQSTGAHAALPTKSAESTTPKPPAVTRATFEPVYRATKAIQGATTSGVAFVKFSELLQSFATEIAVAKDHSLNDADKRLVLLYDEAFDAYHASADFWTKQLSETGAAAERLHGRMIVCVRGRCDKTDLGILAAKYGIDLEDVSSGHGIMVAPADTVQRLWKRAGESVERATRVYYGEVPVVGEVRSR